jgi:hypothetical protein
MHALAIVHLTLFVSFVSSPSDVIPKWNLHSSSHIEAFFEFALHKDACILIFMPSACMPISIPKVKEVRYDVMTYAMTYNIMIVKDWWGINEMPLCSCVDKTLTVWASCFIL